MPFEKGQSGNPAGYKNERRDRLRNKLDIALLEDFDKHGPAVIQQMRAENPAKYIELVLARVPKDPTVVNATIEQRSLVEILSGIGENADIALAAGRAGPVREGSVRLDS